MKTANYNFTDKHNRTLSCTVTLKNDGKVSISLSARGGMFSAATKYQAKALGHQIAKADFKHEAVTSFKEDNVGLVKELTDKTQELKAKYIETCKKWEAEKFVSREVWLADVDIIMYDKGFYSEEFCKRFKINYAITSQHGRTGVHLKYDSSYYKAKNQVEAVRAYIKAGLDYNVKKAERAAINHYENSISKLSQRLNDKGITNESEFTIESTYLGVNFECTIKTKELTVVAWTIIASGEIQKPHYRFLVK